MRYKALLPLTVAFVLATSGCASWPRKQAQAAPGRSRSLDETGKLKAELDSLKAENQILHSRLEEQLAREGRLSDRLNRLKFLSAQQQVQIDTLAQAPAARDKYRRQAERLARRVADLQRQIDQLKAANEKLKATTSAPSTGD